MGHEDEPMDPRDLLDPSSNVFSLGEYHALVSGLGVGFGAGWLGGFMVTIAGTAVTGSVLREEPAYFSIGFAIGAVAGSIVGLFVGRLI